MTLAVSGISKSTGAATVAVVAAIVAGGLVLAACTTPPSQATSSTTAAKTRSTTSSPTTAAGGAQVPTPLAATYTDSPAGQPGYALVVNPGPTGSGIMGGIAVYQYQDGKEVGYFSFHGQAHSEAPFQLILKGERFVHAATAQVTRAPTITIRDCTQLFSPGVTAGIVGEVEPPVPPSCTFSYKLAPSAPPPQPTVVSNLTATPAIKSGLLNEYLFQKGWQTQYGSEITLDPGTTYVAYDPQTGLNWAYATFGYHGPATETSGSPAVAMQDGGDTGFFYQIPDPEALASSDDGWVMVGGAGEPPCFTESLIPGAVIGLWGLVDPPACPVAG